ncbi:MAG TPA: GatB/YqeY domain-containing protein [Candidatus Magasanikbacteria bacterium]|nr:GatB/YqeY domain-containing protein [Candidatus Magasanikbacteria bacterium]
MGTKEKIEQDLVTALKNKESRLSILRMLKTSLQNAVIEKRGKEKNPQVELVEEEILATIKRQIKQLKDSLIDFEKAGRQELISQVQEEIKTLSEYLPPEMSQEDLEKIVDQVIQEMSATVDQIGKVMGLVMKKVAGNADGNRVKEAVTKKLS